MKIGVMFGSPETTTGGNALKFYAIHPPRHPPHRRDQGGGARRGGKDPAVVGNRTRVKVVKNKMAPPFREVEFDILYGQGISRSGDVIDLAADLNIVEKSGAWFSFGGERIGQGRENAKAYLEQHPELLDKLEAMILAKHGIKRGGPDAGARTAHRLRRDGAARLSQAACEREGERESASRRPKPAN